MLLDDIDRSMFKGMVGPQPLIKGNFDQLIGDRKNVEKRINGKLKR
jgi:hypothetical protein